MVKIIRQRILYFCLGLLTLTGCGSSSPTPQITAGISVGTVARSASGVNGLQITVNNVTYTTDNATVTRNGDPAAPEDIKPGMRVTITGNMAGSECTATGIDINEELEGVIERIDGEAGSLTVLGQKVLIQDLTVFDGVTGISELHEGQQVEIHGLSGAAGVIEATRIEVKNTQCDHYVSGPISNFDSIARTFAVRNIVVDYAAAATLPVLRLEDELVVKIQGTYVNGVMEASRISLRHNRLERGHAEQGGLVSEYDEIDGTFTVNGQPVQLTPATMYHHGARSELANGVKVEIKGDVQNGILTASTVNVDGDHGLPVQAAIIIPAFEAAPVSPCSTGRQIYDSLCSNCHMMGGYDPSGSAPNLIGKGGAVADKFAIGHKGLSITATQRTELALFLNAE
ncbi:MAG: DUF5666 domain-containing protein [Desulfuromonadaceae bacterium]|nr:DUF5666 domain-containing protein [Desulfuromonadaceae bacterium]